MRRHANNAADAVAHGASLLETRLAALRGAKRDIDGAEPDPTLSDDLQRVLDNRTATWREQIAVLRQQETTLRAEADVLHRQQSANVLLVYPRTEIYRALRRDKDVSIRVGRVREREALGPTTPFGTPKKGDDYLEPYPVRVYERDKPSGNWMLAGQVEFHAHFASNDQTRLRARATSRRVGTSTA